MNNIEDREMSATLQKVMSRLNEVQLESAQSQQDEESCGLVDSNALAREQKEGLIEVAGQILNIIVDFKNLDSLTDSDSAFQKRYACKRNQLLDHIYDELLEAIAIEAGRAEVGRLFCAVDSEADELTDDELSET